MKLNIMKRILLIISVLTLCSCSAQYRLNQLVKKHPELRTATDTVYLRDTIIIPELSESVIVSDSFLKTDTAIIFVSAGNALATLEKVGNYLKLTATQQPDTIYIEKPVEIPVYQIVTKAEMTKKQSFFYYTGVCFWSVIGIMIIALFLLYLGYKFFPIKFRK